MCYKLDNSTKSISLPRSLTTLDVTIYWSINRIANIQTRKKDHLKYLTFHHHPNAKWKEISYRHMKRYVNHWASVQLLIVRQVGGVKSEAARYFLQKARSQLNLISSALLKYTSVTFSPTYGKFSNNSFIICWYSWTVLFS